MSNATDEDELVREYHLRNLRGGEGPCADVAGTREVDPLRGDREFMISARSGQAASVTGRGCCDIALDIDRYDFAVCVTNENRAVW